MQKESILKNTDVMKAILMLSVIIYHCCIYWANVGWGDFLGKTNMVSDMRNIYLFLRDFHVYGFTVISGYIYSYALEKNKYSSYNELLAKKSKRLIIPYLFSAIFWNIPIDIILKPITLNEIIKNYILAERPSQLWFLIMLFVVFILFFCTQKLQKKFLYGLAISLSFYFLGTKLIDKLPNVIQIFTALQFYIFFWIGFVLYKTNILNKIDIKIEFIIFIFYVILVFTENNGIIVTLTRRIIGSIGAFCLTYTISRNINKECKFINILKKYNFKIYLIHQQIIYFVIMYCSKLCNPYINSIINLIASIVIPIFIIKIVENVLNKFATSPP